MLDIKVVRERPGEVRANIQRRNDPARLKLFEDLLDLDAQYRRSIQETDRLKALRNTISREIAAAAKSGDQAVVTAKKAEAAAIPGQIAQLQTRLDELQAGVRAVALRVPNMIHESVPYGKDAAENVEVRRWGTPREFAFEPRPHSEVAENLGLVDFDRALKVSGAGFNYLLGDLVLLDLALQRYAIELLMERGYTPVEVPLMIRREPYEGVTDLADFESVLYKLDGEDLHLIATSEHPIAARFKDEIVDPAALPLRFCGVSACFRKEIGGHGVDQKGLYRMHQFNKVEQFIFCAPEDSWKLHEELLANTEAIFQGLGLPYRVVNVCTGDLGIVAAKKYDVEAWFPRRKGYGEVASCSNCTDYQARRLNIRVGKQGGDKRILHTLNNTAVATSRAMVAVLENYQRADGTVEVPEVLRPYLGGREELRRIPLVGGP